MFLIVYVCNTKREKILFKIRNGGNIYERLILGDKKRFICPLKKPTYKSPHSYHTLSKQEKSVLWISNDIPVTEY